MSSITRAELRRKLGLRTGQPFFRRFGTSQLTGSASGTTTTLVDTAHLKEEDDYWNGQYIYFPASDEVREISDFDQGTSTITWLAAIASSTTSSTAYEIWSQFSPLQVNEAINWALEMAWPYFFLSTYDESLCVKDGRGLKYTLPTTNTIRRLCQVYLQIYDSTTSQITTEGTTAQVIDSSASFTSSDVGKYVAAYKDCGDATGEVKAVTAVPSSTELTVSAFSAALPEDGYYRLLNPNDTTPNQLPVTGFITDRPEFPTLMWFGTHPTGYEGYPFYLLYEYEHPTLTTEAGTTTCPPEYVYSLAKAYIYEQKMATAPAVELPTWEAMHGSSLKAAEMYARSHRQQHMGVHRLDHQADTFGVPADYPFR